MLPFRPAAFVSFGHCGRWDTRSRSPIHLTVLRSMPAMPAGHRRRELLLRSSSACTPRGVEASSRRGCEGPVRLGLITRRVVLKVVQWVDVWKSGCWYGVGTSGNGQSQQSYRTGQGKLDLQVTNSHSSVETNLIGARIVSIDVHKSGRACNNQPLVKNKKTHPGKKRKGILGGAHG